MKKAYKIPITIISVIGLINSICVFLIFNYVPRLSDALKDLLLYCEPWLPNTIAGISFFLGLCFLTLILIAIFVPNSENFMIVDQGGGKLLISAKTIESTAFFSFSDLDSISFADVRAKLSSNYDNSRILVKLSLTNSTEIVTITENIRNRIDAALLHSLGISVKTITIQIIDQRHDSKVFNPELIADVKAPVPCDIEKTTEPLPDAADNDIEFLPPDTEFDLEELPAFFKHDRTLEEFDSDEAFDSIRKEFDSDEE